MTSRPGAGTRHRGSRRGRGGTPRAVAVDALVRIEAGAYANLVVPSLLDASSLDARDRGLVTELAYGATRMRRACDWLIGRHLGRSMESLEPAVRAALRLGAYQLRFLRTPAHAAVSATVDAAPARARGLVNAVLRKVAVDDADWPDLATRLSYPDWIVDTLLTDLGTDAGIAALEQMDEPPAVTERTDGYVQDEASQLVAASVAAFGGRRIADLCAAPGGKATALAAATTEPGTVVVACDVRSHRVRLLRDNVARLGAGEVAVVQADGTQPPFPPGSFDTVLVDAPCSGLGVLRRRPDARWTRRAEDVDDLVSLQRALLIGAIPLLAPGGTIVYSVCTLTNAETLGIDEWLAESYPELEAVAPPDDPWHPVGRGARLLPQDKGTDGMFMVALRREGAWVG